MNKACLALSIFSFVTGLSLVTGLTARVAAQAPAQPPAPAQPADLKVPAGFKVSVFASGVAGARLMAVSPDGVVYVALQGKGEVAALPDKDKDGKADKVETVLTGLTRPHSLAFNKGYLYIATNPAVLRVKFANGKIEGTPEKFIDLPVSTTAHWTRTIGFDKSGKFYVSIGSSCNVCEDADERRQTIMVYNADGSGGKPFAKGMRNSIGFDWDPKTGVIWADDMGQDGLGEEFPPDEINRVEAGKHYGFPYFVGNNVANAGLKDAKGSMKATDATPPAFELPAHSSPIDMRFYTGKAFPSAYRGALFLAIHGSSPTGRKEKIGYKVVRVVFKDGKPVGLEDFATGWLNAGQANNGRPAGLLTGADGALYISDDNKGFVYRVSYGK
ncbi:MAG: PQQ-dependent sugar dehydrogenase [Acidobacteria bacterium]|nr:PQQ-dependent sugar dehydrogenase [Acidobacteriota bacterium]MBI3425524.1 PQQ-dependent sugar dehydrogenase [Acidobacteriota bacterium]